MFLSVCLTFSYAPNGLCIRNIEALTAAGQSELEIKFSPDMPGQFNLLARCQSDHPFFVKNKGMCQSNKLSRTSL